MKVLRRIVPIAVVVVAVLLLLYSPDIAPERYTDLATFFRVEMKRQGFAGFSVAAVSDGAVLYVDGFGVDGSGAKLGPDSAIYAPALAKSIAALSASSLARERRLSLDAPLSAYLPWFEFADGSGRDLTLRHLISHTSGLTDSSFDDAHPDAPDLEAAVRLMIRARPSFAPGLRFRYLNTDYQALALAMEKASGLPYADIIDERVFAPLGMSSSSGTSPYTPPIGSVSFFSIPLSRPAASPSFGVPSGYVLTTATDAGQYLAFLLDPDEFPRGPLPSRAVAGLFEPSAPVAPYGYGFYLGREEGSRVAYHDGLLDGFSSRVVLWPDKRSGIVILAAQSSLLQSVFALPAMTAGARRIMMEGYSPRPFPLGRLYILLAVVSAVSVLALIFQTGGALHWAKEVRDKADAQGTRGPIQAASLRCWIGIAVRVAALVFLPAAIGLASERAITWKTLMQLEPGIAAWCMIVCAFGALRNAARLSWIRGPAGIHRPR